MRKRVVFLNRCYWPDAEATGQLLTELCEFLAPRWDVTAVVGQPNFALRSLSAADRKSGERNGVRVERLSHFRFDKKRPGARSLNLVSFTNAVRRWGRRLDAAPDVIVTETDPFLLPLVAAPLARRTGARLVCYLQDIYPDVAVAVDVIRDGRLAKTIRHRLRSAYRQADRVVVLDEDMRDRLVNWGVDAERFSIVPNWVDCAAVRPVKSDNPFRRREGIDKRFVVMHSGNMGMTQRLHVLVEAMRHPHVSPNALLALVGNGADRANLQRASEHMANVRLWDYQPKERLGESLSAADLHVISMDARITGCLAPSKLYGILASATPVLAIVPRESAVWRFVQQHQLGWTAEPGDVDGIVGAINAAAAADAGELAAIGARARQLAEQQFDKATCCRRFEDVLDEVTERR